MGANWRHDMERSTTMNDQYGNYGAMQQVVDSSTSEANVWNIEHRLVMSRSAGNSSQVAAHASSVETTRETEYVGATMSATANGGSRQVLTSSRFAHQDMKEDLRNETIVLHE